MKTKQIAATVEIPRRRDGDGDRVHATEAGIKQHWSSPDLEFLEKSDRELPRLLNLT